jgi:integrase
MLVDQLDALRLLVAAALGQASAGIRPLRRIYDLRHTFATFVLRAGICTFGLPR